MKHPGDRLSHRGIHLVCFVLVEWFVLFCIALWWRLDDIRRLKMGDYTDVTLGPLRLLHVGKVPASSGFTLNLGLAKGLLLLLLVCAAAEGMVYVAVAVHWRHLDGDNDNL